jgi:hypothetical protein
MAPGKAAGGLAFPRRDPPRRGARGPVSALLPPARFDPLPLRLGLRNDCDLTRDVVDVNPAVPNALVDIEYVTPNQTTLPLGILKYPDPQRPWISQTIASDLPHMVGAFGFDHSRYFWLAGLS